MPNNYQPPTTNHKSQDSQHKATKVNSFHKSDTKSVFLEGPHSYEYGSHKWEDTTCTFIFIFGTLHCSSLQHD